MTKNKIVLILLPIVLILAFLGLGKILVQQDETAIYNKIDFHKKTYLSAPFIAVRQKFELKNEKVLHEISNNSDLRTIGNLDQNEWIQKTKDNKLENVYVHRSPQLNHFYDFPTDGILINSYKAVNFHSNKKKIGNLLNTLARANQTIQSMKETSQRLEIELSNQDIPELYVPIRFTISEKEKRVLFFLKNGNAYELTEQNYQKFKKEIEEFNHA